MTIREIDDSKREERQRGSKTARERDDNEAKKTKRERRQ